jgi:hypothetical protein
MGTQQLVACNPGRRAAERGRIVTQSSIDGAMANREPRAAEH